MSVRRYGDRALLVDTTDPLGLAAAVRSATGLPPVVDVVPGAASLLVACASPGDADEVAERLPLLTPVADERPADEVVLPVVYDGADLVDVAHATGLTAAEVRARHCAASYVVALVGFVPGFGYLSGLDPVLHVPRRAEPRARVPAGAVAIAGGWAGVYPRPSPGGWQLLGHSDVELWSWRRDPPALLRPGVRVRFQDVT